MAGLQATSIFVSTISITAIALDRYKVIVYPTHQETASGTRGGLLLLASVWVGALSLSLPLFTYRTVEHHEITSRKLFVYLAPARWPGQEASALKSWPRSRAGQVRAASHSTRHLSNLFFVPSV